MLLICGGRTPDIFLDNPNRRPVPQPPKTLPAPRSPAPAPHNRKERSTPALS